MPSRNIPHPRGSAIERHGEGLGTLTKADIERRAREIAEIENRMVVSPGDRARARAELLHGMLPAAVSEDADTSQSMSRDPSDPAADRGCRTPAYTESDEKTSLERLVLEGVEEAQHDQMTSSRAGEEPFRSRPRKRSAPPGTKSRR